MNELAEMNEDLETGRLLAGLFQRLSAIAILSLVLLLAMLLAT